MQRMLAVWGKVDLSKLRRPSLLTDEDWQRLYDAADVVAHAPIFIDDTPALTTLELRARARPPQSGQRPWHGGGGLPAAHAHQPPHRFARTGNFGYFAVAPRALPRK